MEPVPCISEKVPAAQLRENRETGVIPVRFRRCNGGIRAADCHWETGKARRGC